MDYINITVLTYIYIYYIIFFLVVTVLRCSSPSLAWRLSYRAQAKRRSGSGRKLDPLQAWHNPHRFRVVAGLPGAPWGIPKSLRVSRNGLSINQTESHRHQHYYDHHHHQCSWPSSSSHHCLFIHGHRHQHHHLVRHGHRYHHEGCYLLSWLLEEGFLLSSAKARMVPNQNG